MLKTGNLEIRKSEKHKIRKSRDPEMCQIRKYIFVLETLESGNPEIQEIRKSCYPEIRKIEIPEVRKWEHFEIQKSGKLEIRKSEHPDFRKSGNQINPEIRNSGNIEISEIQ